jgi:hypothetical protein
MMAAPTLQLSNIQFNFKNSKKSFYSCEFTDLMLSHQRCCSNSAAESVFPPHTSREMNHHHYHHHHHRGLGHA